MNVYQNHDKAFKNVSAYAILGDDGTHVGKVAFKFMPSGVVHCYFHIYGVTMIHGKAGGYGYDKIGASIADAYERCHDTLKEHYKALATITYDGQWREVLQSHGLNIIRVL